MYSEEAIIKALKFDRKKIFFKFKKELLKDTTIKKAYNELGALKFRK